MSLKWHHSSLRTIQRKLGLSSLWDAIILFQPAFDDDDTSKPWHFIDSGEEIAKIQVRFCVECHHQSYSLVVRQYPLNIELLQKSGFMVVRAACQVAFLDEPGLRSLLEGFVRVIKDILDNPQTVALPDFPISDDSSMTGPDKVAGEVKPPIVDKFFPDIHSDIRFERLLDIISTCTKVPLSIIRADSSLASLGVDSISAIHISSKARLASITLHAAQILHCETISDLQIALCIQDQGTLDEEEIVMPVVPPALKSALLQQINAQADLVDDVYPASPGIKWLVGMWQLSRRSRFQHAFAFKLPDDVDKNRLKSAWSKVANASEILRSTFVSTDSSSLYVVTFKEFPRERLWLEKYSNDGETDLVIVRETMKELVSSPLSTTLPPAQAIFLQHNSAAYFILHLHHSQYDAWSLQLLVNDIERTYSDSMENTKHTHEVFMRHYLSKRARELQQQYWSTYFPHPFLPSLLPRIAPRVAPGTFKRQVLTVNAVLDDLFSLRHSAQQMSLSLNAVFLACWAQVQASFIGNGTATFGLWHLGRTGTSDGMESLAYPCMNVLPVHVKTSRLPTRQICNDIQGMLRQRTAVIEQSYLEDVSKWVNHSGILCNIFLNIVVPYEDMSHCPVRDRVLQPVTVSCIANCIGTKN